MKRTFAVLALALLASIAVGDEDDAPPPPPRPPAKKPVEPPKFADGKLIDSYWGVTYFVPNLEQKKGERQFGKLFDGKSGRVQIEVGVWEYADELSAKDRRAADKKKWDDKKKLLDEYAQGDDPTPWATFVGEAPSGDKRREGYAWTARGPRTFVVHAYAAMDAEGGAEGVKAALFGLTVGPETGAAVLAQMTAKKNGLPWDDLEVQRAAAQQYLEEDEKSGVPARPGIALDLVRRAIESIPGSRVEGKYDRILAMHQTLAGAQMKAKRFDEAQASLAKCLEIAAKSDRPGPMAAHVQYDVACCCSLMGKVDDAFVALGKAFERAADWGPPVTDEDLKKDKDLENCRKDPRWEKFMATKPGKAQ